MRNDGQDWTECCDSTGKLLNTNDSQSERKDAADTQSNAPRRTLGCKWWRDGKSITTVLKGIVKISLVSAKRNIDGGLRSIFHGRTKTSFGRFPVIWGDFGRSFTGNPRAKLTRIVRTFLLSEERANRLAVRLSRVRVLEHGVFQGFYRRCS